MTQVGRASVPVQQERFEADEKPAEPVPTHGNRMALRNWRVRTRLITLIAIPTLVAVILGAMRVGISISSAEQNQRISNVGSLVAQLGELSREVALERDLSAHFVASNRAPTQLERLTDQRKIVDASVQRTTAAATQAEDSLSDLGRRKLAIVRTRLTQLASLRDTVSGNASQLPPLPTMEKYSEVIDDMLQLYDEVAQGSTDEQLIATSAALRAVARSEEEAAKLRGLLTIALVKGAFEEPELKAFLDARSNRASERAAFRAVATLAQRQFHDNTVTSVEVGRGEFYINRAVFLANAGLPLRRLDASTSNDVTLWFNAISDTVNRLHTVQRSLLEQVGTRSADIQSSDRSAATLNIIVVAALLLLVLGITAVMARSLVRPLRRLRGDALMIASQSLPELVQQLRTSEVDAKQLQVPPIAISSKDEIGEVARAFDEVHREAVRLAGEEAHLRSNVNAMFVNLSRRSQTLVERQITLIDGLEQGEQDEQRLGNLFKLDHLATRMRRNSENLLVLAGQEPPRRWSKPVQLVDVVRASLSEVENYERVVLQVPDAVSVAGQAVNDIIHLLAELVENALSFSPREAQVTVSGSRIDGGGVMLAISDAGIGMTQEELAHANDRLMNAPTVDVSVSRRMGLFVVARLAHRHGVRVQLRPHESGGLTAMVLMPETLLATQAPAYAGGSPDAFQAPPPQWGSYQMGPGHPSYPSSPSGSWLAPERGAESGDWPSVPRTAQPAPRAPEPSDWPSVPRTAEPSPYGYADSGSYGSADTWTPPRNRQNLPGDDTFLPRRRNLSEPQQRPSGYDFPETASAATGPIPAAKAGSDEYLPIYASIESAWFEQGAASWGSADAGWHAAKAAAEPVRDGVTSTGLPKRVPKANLVPGAASTPGPAAASAGPAATGDVTPMPPVSADRVRSRLASFQQGYRSARDDISMGKTTSDPTNRGQGT
ncbi:Signal transduction histidine kinase [Nonomuraea solani]|uniref:histidine kinase n=1 Tax=Nonomuraea solani TaxID=1144553 RepID=A0A1H6DTM1_9ACTN|nr:nitrate- and nitrite sensing domain-containing protein [Nonomuraea solani]SEG88618.1 Signal transduction histidine kinase [Nonomuraea solani]